MLAIYLVDGKPRMIDRKHISVCRFKAHLCGYSIEVLSVSSFIMNVACSTGLALFSKILSNNYSSIESRMRVSEVTL